MRLNGMLHRCGRPANFVLCVPFPNYFRLTNILKSIQFIKVKIVSGLINDEIINHRPKNYIYIIHLHFLFTNEKFYKKS